MHTYLTEDEEALKAYRNYFRRKGIDHYDGPSSVVDIKEGFVFISTGHGQVAKYNLKTRRLSFKNLN